MSLLCFKTKWKSPTRMQIPFKAGKHSRESLSKSVKTKRSAINSTALLLRRQTDGKNENGYKIINHMLYRFQSPADVRL
jgi:hypothetical protein